MKIVSIIFSFRNEESNILELVKRVSKVFNTLEWNYELIFVNDASTDSSENLLINLQKNFPITIINMSRTFGVGPCVLAGFKYSKSECVIYMDSDLQDPPEIIPDLLDEYDKGYDVVHTVRTSRKGENFFKLALTNIAYRIINFFSGIKLSNNAGDFKLLSRKIVDIILSQGDHDPYIRGMSVWAGHNQTSISYERQPRFNGKTHFSIFSKGPFLEFLRGVTSYSNKPLYLSIFLGLIGILISVILSLYIVYLKFNNLTVSGVATIIIAISFFSSLILFNLGIVGIYLGKVFEKTKNRSLYIIKDIKTYKKN